MSIVAVRVQDVMRERLQVQCLLTSNQCWNDADIHECP